MLKRLDAEDEERAAPDLEIRQLEQHQQIAPAELAGYSWLAVDGQALLFSLVFHLVIVVGLAVIPLVVQLPDDISLFAGRPLPEVDQFTFVEEIAPSDQIETEIGSNSEHGDLSALSKAPILAELSELPPEQGDVFIDQPTVQLSHQLQSVGLIKSEQAIKGMTGIGTTGTEGAVDQITYHILRSIEERPTLVVWFFDQSGSLLRRREEIRDRFNHIYEELGIIQNAQSDTHTQDPDSAPLLTSIIAFGESINLLTPRPTADMQDIRTAIDSIELDGSGIERVFSALFLGVDKFKSYAAGRGNKQSRRNVMFVVVTDEKGNDAAGLDKTINECLKYGIPVYVVGVPAPFGRELTYIKYVDPDPNFDQSPSWAEVEQGPETIMPERVRLGYQNNRYFEPVIDSGFGPFALSRLAYETGGIYFTVHPNRRVGQRVRGNEIDPFASNLEYFFDPEQMIKYRPDYVSVDEYKVTAQQSALRTALLEAARFSATGTLEQPKTTFVKSDEAAFVNELSLAQRDAAKLEPQLGQLAMILETGVPAREQETSARWLAGFDLALGTVLFHKVRAESFNAMLAKAKRGMAFVDSKNNTWVLRPSEEISVGSRTEKEAERAKELLRSVATTHAQTPWGLLAERELRNPVGWKWEETYTELNPPAAPNSTNNNPQRRPPQDDQARMLAPPAPKRPVPKL
ncbi:MAG: VWA domain-containing protein [Planctomycetales bacterium]|nr:VWA domain-containing protein [Planctomycetales bacterium]